MRLRFQLFLPLFLFLFLALPRVLAAADFSVLVLPGDVARVEAVWKNHPAETEPSLYPLRQVSPGQPFQVLVLARGFGRNAEGSADIAYSLKILGPDGRPVEGAVPGLELYRGPVPEAEALLLSRQYLTLVFAPEDPVGLYSLAVTAVDAITGLQAQATANLQVRPIAAAEAFADAEAFRDWMSNYYRDPDPGRVLTAIDQFVSPAPEGLRTGGPLLLFFARILQDNPFLRAPLQQAYTAADSSGRERLLLVLAAGGDTLSGWIGQLAPAEAAFYREARHFALPDPTLPPASILEINALWAQFYATGDIAPLRALCAGLALHSTKGVQERIAAGILPETAESRAQAAMEEVYKALLWSLVSHGNQHLRVEKYLRLIGEERSLPPELRPVLDEVLQIIEKDRLEEAAKQKLQKQGAGESSPPRQSDR